MKSFRNLVVWQKAHQLTVASYTATRDFPKEELYGLTSQIRRASVSIAANIAEGCGKQGNAEFRRYLLIAMGSASELEYLLLLSQELAMVRNEEYAPLNDKTVEIKLMLSSLIRKTGASL